MADTADFDIDQGATFDFDIEYTDDAGNPINIAGWHARMQIRRAYGESGPPLYEVTDTSGITIDGVNGKISVVISNTDTAKFKFKRAVYDLVIASPTGDMIERLIEGQITVKPRVTIY